MNQNWQAKGSPYSWQAKLMIKIQLIVCPLTFDLFCLKGYFCNGSWLIPNVALSTICLIAWFPFSFYTRVLTTVLRKIVYLDSASCNKIFICWMTYFYDRHYVGYMLLLYTIYYVGYRLLYMIYYAEIDSVSCWVNLERGLEINQLWCQ